MTDIEFSEACARYVRARQANRRLTRLSVVLVGALLVGPPLATLAAGHAVAMAVVFAVAAGIASCALGGIASINVASRESRRILASVHDHPDVAASVTRLREYERAREVAHAR